MKIVFTLAVLVVIGVGILLFSIMFNSAKNMEYQIVFGELEPAEVFVKLNSRVCGYSVSKTTEGLTLVVQLDKKYSGEVTIGLNSKSGILYFQDEQAHAGGKAWLRCNKGEIDVEYFQQNYF